MLAVAHDLHTEAEAPHLRSALLLMPAPIGPAGAQCVYLRHALHPNSSLIITTFDSGTPGPSDGAEAAAAVTWSARWRRRPVTQVCQPLPSLVDLGLMVWFVIPSLSSRSNLH
jgi:hypothetical protein